MKTKTIPPLLVAALCLAVTVLAAGTHWAGRKRMIRFGPLPSLGQVPASPGPQTPPKTPPKEGEAAGAAASTGAHELTAADVEAFLAGIVPLQLEQDDIAGATVSVVKDGKLLFAKGYGYADVANKKPVSADATLFRCGSISKLFTWTAIMQLNEQGKVDLDRDVNDYLDFKMPSTFGKPITLRNLLTHTPGFEESIKGLISLKANDSAADLGTVLKAHLPEQIFPPGTVPAYSNYGAGLAGYIVQRVSGMPLDRYIEQNILQPLGMTRTSFEQPLPPDLAPLMSNGYKLASEAAKPFETLNPWPAGSIASSAIDISHFMIAHLQNGQYGDARILRTETAQLMHSRQFGLDPNLNGMACGFYEESRNGHRIIGHGGDTIWFHSDLHLIPDSNVGFFISYNSAGRGDPGPRSMLWYAFLDRYFPYQLPDEPPVASAKEDARKVAGAYFASRRIETTFPKTLYLLDQFEVSANDDGTIECPNITGFNGQPKHWKEIAPMRYREVEGQDQFVVVHGPAGEIELAPDVPVVAFQRAPWKQDSQLLGPVMAAALTVLALTLILWPIAALVRRHYGKKLELGPRARRLRIVVKLVCAVDLVFIAGFGGLMLYCFDKIWLLNVRLDPWIHALQVIGVIAVAGTFVLIYNALTAWLNPDRGIWSKLYATLLVVASLGYVWFVIVGNLLNFNLKY